MSRLDDPHRQLSVPKPLLAALAAALLALPASAQPIEVNAADPDSAEQGTVNLDVVISGDGFGSGAVVRFLLTGTGQEGGVNVKSTKVRGPRKLVANVDVEPDATVSDFDIEVQVNGRVGKGTELFAVLEATNGGQNVATCDSLRDAPADRVMSDARGQYCDGDGQLVAIIGAQYGGHRLDTEKSGREVFLDYATCANSGSTPCSGPPFAMTEFVFTIDTELDPEGVNLLGMLPGESRQVGVLFGYKEGNKKEVRLSFGRLTGSVVCAEGPGDKVTVTRGVAPDENSWTFESFAGQRACLSQFQRGKNSDPTALGYYEMPFRLEVRAQP